MYQEVLAATLKYARLLSKEAESFLASDFGGLAYAAGDAAVDVFAVCLGGWHRLLPVPCHEAHLGHLASRGVHMSRDLL